MFDKKCKYHNSCGADMCHGEGVCKDFERGKTMQRKAEKKINELKPCPFCGGDAEIKKRGNSVSYWVVYCAPCRAEVKGTTREEATEAWNRRA